MADNAEHDQSVSLEPSDPDLCCLQHQDARLPQKSGYRAIDELQRALVEVETRYKSQISALQQKYETDVRELEVGLDNAIRANTEYHKQVNVLQSKNKEFDAALEDTTRQLEDSRAQLSFSKRKCLGLEAELKDARTLIERAERGRKTTESELHEASVRLSEVTASITTLTSDKRRLEADVMAMQTDLEDALNGCIAAEERAERLQAEVKKLADELRQEQENLRHSDDLRQQLEMENRQISKRLEEAEALANKEGKRRVITLQNRIRDIEGEIEVEQRRSREALANQRKVERQYKEAVAMIEDDRRAISDLTGLNDSLNLKLKAYRRQLEEAEEVANIAMNKYRKATALVQDAENRAELAEKNLQTVRRSRSMSVSTELTRVVRL